MEIVLSVFLGLWISGAGICALLWLKKEFKSNPKNGTEISKEAKK